MVNIKAMLKSWNFLPLDLDEVPHKWTLGYSKRLSDNDVVFVGEQGEGKFNEVQTPCLIKFVNTEEVDDYGIVRVKGNLWQLVFV